MNSACRSVLRQEGFFAYVEHLHYYASVVPENCAPGYNAGRAYPIGVLRGDGDLPDVRLHFLHYRTFDEACAAWIRRTGRIDWENICVVMYADVPEESELVNRFAALPYARKVLLSCTRMNVRSCLPMIFRSCRSKILCRG